jgi:hypothetical protein
MADIRNPGPLSWQAILKKDISMVSESLPAGTVVRLTKDIRGNTHIVGYRSAVLRDDEWEMFWNEPAYEDLLRKYSN